MTSEELQPKFKLFSVDELAALPPTDWLIERIFEKQSQVVLYGPSGDGKSFLALDWALCIATGRRWNGLKVKKGPVIYVAGEGSKGVLKRVRAWQTETGEKDLSQFFVVREPVQIRNGDDRRLLLSRIKGANVRPFLIILDTFARCFVGGEENSAKDVGEFVNGEREVQEEAGSAVLSLHHTGKKGDMERGSSALRGAADTMIALSKDGEVISVENTKQKDEEEFELMQFELKRISVGHDAEGKPITSCVIVPTSAKTLAARYEGVLLNTSQKRALIALSEFPEAVASSGDWRLKITPDDGKAEAKKKTFDNWRGALANGGFVEAVPGRAHDYRLTEKGRDAIGVPSAPHQETNTPATPTTRRVGAAEEEGGGARAPDDDDCI